MSDPKPEEVKVEESAVKEEKPSVEGGKKGGFSARGGRGGRNQGVKYVKKGEKDTEEEHKGEHEPHEHKEHKEGERGQRKQWKGDRRNKEEKQKEKEKITLDTVIPEKPKKHDILKEPNEEEFHKHLDEIDGKIDAVYDRLKKFSKEMRDTQSENKGNKDYLPLKDLLTVKFSERAKLSDEINVLRVQNDEKKAAIEDLFSKATKYRQKLKKYFKKDEIETALKELIDTQRKGNITLAEEKVVIKEIAELEKALPFAGPLEVVTKELEELKVDRKKITDQLTILFDQRKVLDKEIEELKTDIENRKKEKDDVLKKLDPIIESKKEDYKKEIDDLKDEKQKIKDKFHTDRDAYYKQQQLIQDIEWKTKIKNRLIREEQRKQWEAEEKAAEELEKKEVEKFNPHQEDINLCDLLINYVQNLLPKAFVAENPEEKKQELSQQVQDDWKKQKFTVIQSKKETDGDFFSAKSKKKPDNKKKPKEEPVNEKQALHHQFEVLGYFEKLKVPPPLLVSKLEETVKLLKEKKDYYSGLPLEEPKKEKAETEEKTEEKKPEPKKKANKHGIEVNESDFPTI